MEMIGRGCPVVQKPFSCCSHQPVAWFVPGISTPSLTRIHIH